MEQRYYVDARSGCIAVRDRTQLGGEYVSPGLHEDSVGVVWYRVGISTNKVCPTCGHERFAGWVVQSEVVEEAFRVCKELNDAS